MSLVSILELLTGVDILLSSLAGPDPHGRAVVCGGSGPRETNNY